LGPPGISECSWYFSVRPHHSLLQMLVMTDACCMCHLWRRCCHLQYIMSVTSMAWSKARNAIPERKNSKGCGRISYTDNNCQITLRHYSRVSASHHLILSLLIILFSDQGRNGSHIATYLVIIAVLFVGAMLFKQSLKLRHFKSDRDEIWHDCS